ncbi:MAG: dienelactone hydrolase family protein [Longimicrobiales bacterium]
MMNRQMVAMATLALVAGVSAYACASRSGNAPQSPPLPPDAGGALARLNASPRHGEYQMIRTGPNDSVRVWVVYPERATRAPVVLVVHEIYGLSNWVRSVADQLAADGFIAIAPDLVTSKNVPSDSLGDPDRTAVTAAIRTLNVSTVQRQLGEIAKWGMARPSATQKYGIVGFCWGGGASFDHAISAPDLDASVVYYGSPSLKDLAAVKAPILGLYGGTDARIGATIPVADSAMKALGKTYEPHSFAGAGHGFARQQTGQNGANDAAIKEAWPLTVNWFRKYLGK